MSWKTNGPVLLDAIYYDQLSSDEQRSSYGEALHQGEQSRTWVASNNLNMQPIKYYGGVDRNTDGQYTNIEKEAFAAWIEENIPTDYTGPICLDMEGQWWSMWNTGSQDVMDVIIDYYIEGLQYAQSLRPNAKIGYWGLPKKSHTSATSQTASVQRLVEASTGIVSRCIRVESRKRRFSMDRTPRKKYDRNCQRGKCQSMFKPHLDIEILKHKKWFSIHKKNSSMIKSTRH